MYIKRLNGICEILLLVVISIAPPLFAAEPPSVGFPAPSSRGLEGRLPADIWVRLSAPSDKPVTVDYKITGGSATAAKDYQFTEGTLTFAPKETKKSIEIAARLINEMKSMCQGAHIMAIGWEEKVPQVLDAAGL